MSVQQWWDGGEVVELEASGVRRRVFVEVMGDGPALTLLHGYPASSYEWAEVVPALAAAHRVVTFDFLGFGASDKPERYGYPLDDQADLVQAVWRHLGVASSEVVAYDYGAIVAQVLMSRGAPITRLTYLNAGLFPDLYRPRRIQTLAPKPVIGALLWRRYDEPAFTRGWGAVFGTVRPLSPAVAHQHWLALTRDDPARRASRALLSYIAQREARADELVATLRSDVPTRFLWGMADPVSGALVAGGIRSRLAEPDLVEHADVGHVPHLEIPDQIAGELLARR